jgi:hypothetical protein
MLHQNSASMFIPPLIVGAIYVSRIFIEKLYKGTILCVSGNLQAEIDSPDDAQQTFLLHNFVPEGTLFHNNKLRNKMYKIKI